MNSTQFHGKTAIITGGASGIGAAIGRRLLQAGANVVVADIDEAAAQHTIESWADPKRTAAEKVDVTNPEHLEDLITTSSTRFGGVDIMVNNAGIEISGEARYLSRDHWERTLDINLYGVVHGTRLAYAYMVERGRGHIVNIASGAGLVMFPTSIPYTTAKAGVVGLTRALRAEAQAYGIGVTLVNPGMVDTPIYDRAVSIGPKIRAFSERLPGRMVTAQRAGDIIVDAISRNRAEVTFPLENVVGAWLVNVVPEFGRWLRRDLVRKFRAMPGAGNPKP